MMDGISIGKYDFFAFSRFIEIKRITFFSQLDSLWKSRKCQLRIKMFRGIGVHGQNKVMINRRIKTFKTNEIPQNPFVLPTNGEWIVFVLVQFVSGIKVNFNVYKITIIVWIMIRWSILRTSYCLIVFFCSLLNHLQSFFLFSPKFILFTFLYSLWLRALFFFNYKGESWFDLYFFLHQMERNCFWFHERFSICLFSHSLNLSNKNKINRTENRKTKQIEDEQPLCRSEREYLFYCDWSHTHILSLLDWCNKVIKIQNEFGKNSENVFKLGKTLKKLVLTNARRTQLINFTFKKKKYHQQQLQLRIRCM